MPEQRARTYHRNRVANTFSEEIGAMLEGELSDPRIAPSYVTDVVLAPGGKSARIFVAVHGNEEEEASTLEGLTTARAYIRSQLRDRMGVRHVPDLTFAIDRSEKRTGRMDKLLTRTRKRQQKRTPPPAPRLLEAPPIIHMPPPASARRFPSDICSTDPPCPVPPMVYHIPVAPTQEITPPMPPCLSPGILSPTGTFPSSSTTADT